MDKNLFLYDLAVVAILKNEGRYIKEWLDYHLLAGVDHFYLFDNDSTDNYNEIIAPYVEAGLVTSTPLTGKSPQFAAYDFAVRDWRFFCRYMAFIDLDEFILPKKNQSIVKTLDEIFSRAPEASGLAINWQLFGSNGHERQIFHAACWNDSLGALPSIGLCRFRTATSPAAIRKLKPLPTREKYFCFPARISRFISVPNTR